MSLFSKRAMRTASPPPHASRRQQPASSTSTSRRRRKTSSDSSASGHHSSKDAKRAQRSHHASSDDDDAVATPTSPTCTTAAALNYSTSLYHNPLLLIIVALLVALCPIPRWMAVPSLSSAAAEIAASSAADENSNGVVVDEVPPAINGQRNHILGGLFDAGKDALKKEKETLASSTERATAPTASKGEGLEKNKGMEEKEDSSQVAAVCTASSQKENNENCISGQELGGAASDPEGESPTAAVVNAGAVEESGTESAVTETTSKSARAADVNTDTVTTENEEMALDGTTAVASADDADHSSAAASTAAFTCRDVDDGCDTWTNGGTSTESCILNSAYMTHHCPVSCNTCDIVNFGYRMITTKGLEGGLAIIPFCQDHHYDCRAHADNGECTKNPEYMHIVCEASCGKCAEESNDFGVGQRLERGNEEEYQLVTDWLENSVKYMHTIRRDERYARVIDDCLNLNPDCTFWAATGECDKNPDYMTVNCGPACMTCDDHF